MDRMDDHSVLRLSPFLTSRGLRTVLSLVILLGNVIPIGRKDSSATGLEALHHGPALFLVTILIDLLEEQRTSVNSIVLVMVKDVSFNLLIELIPVVFDLGTRRIVELTLLDAFRNAQAVSSEEGPVFTRHLLLHHNLNGLESEVMFGADSIDLLEEGEIELVVASVIRNGEVNTDSILLKLDLQIFFFFDRVRDLNTHLRGSLIPGVLIALSIPQDLVLEHVFLSQLDHCALIKGCLP